MNDREDKIFQYFNKMFVTKRATILTYILDTIQTLCAYVCTRLYHFLLNNVLQNLEQRPCKIATKNNHKHQASLFLVFVQIFLLQ